MVGFFKRGPDHPCNCFRKPTAFEITGCKTNNCLTNCHWCLLYQTITHASNYYDTMHIIAIYTVKNLQQLLPKFRFRRGYIQIQTFGINLCLADVGK